MIFGKKNVKIEEVPFLLWYNIMFFQHNVIFSIYLKNVKEDKFCLIPNNALNTAVSNLQSLALLSRMQLATFTSSIGGFTKK